MAGRETDTWMGGPQHEFATTLWTVVVNAKNPASPERREALQKLIETYWKPLYHYARCKGNDPESSKDAVQGFFAAVLEKDLLQYVEPGRARFRTFLLLAMKHHLGAGRTRDTAIKRGGGRPVLSLELDGIENEVNRKSEADTPDQVFRRAWAVRVLEQALEKLRSDYESAGRLDEFDAIRLHLGAGSAPKKSYAEVAAALSLKEDDVRNRIHRARGLYREAILGVIRSYSESEDQAKEELRDLLSAFE